MRLDLHIPNGRARCYRWVGISGFGGVAWSLVLAFAAAMFFNYLPATPGRPVSHGLVSCPYPGFVVLGGVDHWILSSTCIVEVVAPRNWYHDIEFEDQAGWMVFPPSGAPIGSLITTRAFGWPFRCLVRQEPLLPPTSAAPRPAAPPTGFVVPNGVYAFGLFADAAAYAVLLFALGWGPGAMRRRLRCRRGACGACGYSLAGNSSGLCPECGAACHSDSRGSSTSGGEPAHAGKVSGQ